MWHDWHQGWEESFMSVLEIAVLNDGGSPRQYPDWFYKVNSLPKAHESQRVHADYHFWNDCGGTSMCAIVSLTSVWRSIIKVVNVYLTYLRSLNMWTTYTLQKLQLCQRHSLLFFGRLWSGVRIEQLGRFGLRNVGGWQIFVPGDDHECNFVKGILLIWWLRHSTSFLRLISREETLLSKSLSQLGYGMRRFESSPAEMHEFFFLVLKTMTCLANMPTRFRFFTISLCEPLLPLTTQLSCVCCIRILE